MSVVIPAHDEEEVVGRCLRVLLADAHAGEFDVVVVANGCRDATAEAARRAAHQLPNSVRVVELERASKAAALAVGDELSRTWPRLYLDADSVCTTTSARLLAVALQKGVELAVPERVLDFTQAAPLARAHHRAWLRLPWVSTQLSGRGCYALAHSGRSRFGVWPEDLPDDTFVVGAVPANAAVVVVGATVRVFPPRDLSSVLRVRTRVYARNLQMRHLPGRHLAGRRARLRLAALRSPGAVTDLVVYSAVAAVAKQRARHQLRSGTVVWGSAPRAEALR